MQEGDSIRQPHETDWVQAAVCSDECGCGIKCPRRFADVRGTLLYWNGDICNLL